MFDPLYLIILAVCVVVVLKLMQINRRFPGLIMGQEKEDEWKS
ncbi:hypothetical protein V5T82_16300 [Magnetovibrio sp. PR-2]